MTASDLGWGGSRGRGCAGAAAARACTTLSTSRLARRRHHAACCERASAASVSSGAGAARRAGFEFSLSSAEDEAEEAEEEELAYAPTAVPQAARGRLELGGAGHLLEAFDISSAQMPKLVGTLMKALSR